VGNSPPTPRVSTKPAFAEYPLSYSMDLVELGARSMDLVDLEFSEPGCRKKLEWSYFCESGAGWSPRHAVRKRSSSIKPSQKPVSGAHMQWAMWSCGPVPPVSGTDILIRGFGQPNGFKSFLISSHLSSQPPAEAEQLGEASRTFQIPSNPSPSPNSLAEIA
jgi:hypothetical protein